MGSGTDTVTGGAGSDLFTFTSTDKSNTSSPDKITDFVNGEDKLVFSGLLSGTFSYLGTSTALSGSGNSEAYFVNDTATLVVDTNGDGTADMQMTLSGKTADNMSASDFRWSSS